jgi:hypothetical protein
MFLTPSHESNAEDVLGAARLTDAAERQNLWGVNRVEKRESAGRRLPCRRMARAVLTAGSSRDQVAAHGESTKAPRTPLCQA